MKKIVVFASGSGTNFQAVINAVGEGKVHAEIAGLVAGKKGIAAIDRAKKNDIPVYTLTDSDRASAGRYLITLRSVLGKWKPDLIVLAGYLRKIPPEIIDEYPGRIINIHPSLLPKYGGRGFYGIKVHEAVIANHEKESGCSVHLVTREYDEGPVIGQVKVPVYPSDDAKQLQKRILTHEHRLLPEVIEQMLKSKIK